MACRYEDTRILAVNAGEIFRSRGKLKPQVQVSIDAIFSRLYHLRLYLPVDWII